MRRVAAVLVALAVSVGSLTAQAPDSTDATPQIVGHWGRAAQVGPGVNWLLLNIYADSTFAMARVYADSEGVYPVAGWTAPVVGTVRVQVVMGDTVLCFKRSVQPAGVLNPPIFNGAHCSPVATVWHAGMRFLSVGDLLLFPVRAPGDDAPDLPLTSS